MIETSDKTHSAEDTALMNIDEKELESFVAPAYPESFASGCIINGFTP